MSEQELPHLLRMLLDESAQPNQRADAARRLAGWSTHDVLDALLQVAQADNADESVSRAVGKSIAEVLIRRDEVDHVPLHDFNGDAFLAYDEVIGRRQR
jgi:hypothetical protein